MVTPAPPPLPEVGKNLRAWLVSHSQREPLIRGGCFDRGFFPMVHMRCVLGPATGMPTDRWGSSPKQHRMRNCCQELKFPICQDVILIPDRASKCHGGYNCMDTFFWGEEFLSCFFFLGGLEMHVWVCGGGGGGGVWEFSKCLVYSPDGVPGSVRAFMSYLKRRNEMSATQPGEAGLCSQRVAICFMSNSAAITAWTKASAPERRSPGTRLAVCEDD